MKTDVDIEYVSPITYELFEWELPAREPVAPPEAEASDVSQNDLGYFMTMAGRHKLLTAEEKRTLGAALWTARRRLLRILRRARADSDEFPAIETSPPTRPVTPSTRRRLAKVERLARELNEALKRPGRVALEGFTKTRLRAHRTSLSDTLGEMDEVRRELVECNLRLVVWVAKRFRERGFNFIDVIQEGSQRRTSRSRRRRLRTSTSSWMTAKANIRNRSSVLRSSPPKLRCRRIGSVHRTPKRASGCSTARSAPCKNKTTGARSSFAARPSSSTRTTTPRAITCFRTRALGKPEMAEGRGAEF